MDEMRLGMQVATFAPWEQPIEAAPASVAYDEPRLRAVYLVLDYGEGHRVDIGLLRGIEWIERERVHEGGTVFLNMPEMGVVGHARVTAIQPCPPLEAGPGKLVTGTFRHSRAQLIDLWVQGEPEAIGVTDGHPFWSADRRTWVPAGELRFGERLAAEDGSTPVVLRIERCDEEEEVFNIEVDGDHVYRVGEQGLLVHNQSAGITYLGGTPMVVAPCGGAKDIVSITVSGTNLPSGGMIIQKVIWNYQIQQKGKEPIVATQADSFFEVFDLVAFSSGLRIPFPDSFQGHSKAGPDTKGWWSVTGSIDEADASRQTQ